MDDAIKLSSQISKLQSRELVSASSKASSMNTVCEGCARFALLAPPAKLMTSDVTAGREEELQSIG